MSAEDMGKFPDGRIFIKDGYQPTEATKRGYQPNLKQPPTPLHPPTFESGVVMPQGKSPASTGGLKSKE